MRREMNWGKVPGAMLLAVLFAAIVMACAEYVGAANLPMIGLAAFLVSMAMAFLPGNVSKAGLSMMAVQVEIWENHIEGNLFKNNEFLLRSFDASQYVLEGKVVHIPQAGALPNIVKNRAFTGAPITATQRTDTDVTYPIDEYTSDPIQIPNADNFELSYSKRESVLKEHEAALNEAIADIMLINWAPSVATNILRTTGDATEAYTDSATGFRKKITTKDVRAAQLALNKQKVPMTGRVALLSADMYSQLQENLSETQFRDFSRTMDPATGKLGTLYSFDMYMRATVLTYDNQDTPVVKAYGSAGAADDNDTALFWQEDAVERAKGTTKFFTDPANPVYFGDIYSMLQRMGGRKRRADQRGVIAMVQAAGANN